MRPFGVSRWRYVSAELPLIPAGPVHHPTSGSTHSSGPAELRRPGAAIGSPSRAIPAAAANPPPVRSPGRPIRQSRWRPGHSTLTAGTTCTTAVQPRTPPGSCLGEWRVHERPYLPAGTIDVRFRSRSPCCHSCAAGCPQSATASAPPGSGTPASDPRDPGGQLRSPDPPLRARGRC